MMTDKYAPPKDPIFHEPMRLTPTEAGAQALQMEEHRAQKCYRCKGRFDLSDGGMLCERGMDCTEHLNNNKPKCPRFLLDEDPDNWRTD